MVEGKRTESPMDKVWKFFTSLKLAIFVIIILAVASIIGTIIEQNQPLEKYRQFYSDGTIRLFAALTLFDMYHSWWFLLLLVLQKPERGTCPPLRLESQKNPRYFLWQPSHMVGAFLLASFLWQSLQFVWYASLRATTFSSAFSLWQVKHFCSLPAASL